MNGGWQTSRLGDLSDLVTKGTTPTSVGYEFVQDGINFVKVESISLTGEIIPDKLAHITVDCNTALGRSQLQAGDILFSIAGALGRTALVTDDILPANTNQALSIIRLRRDADVSAKFVLRALETGIVLEQIEAFRGGVAQQNPSLAQVREFQISFPSLAEQRRILGILDEAFEGIATAKANAEKNLQNARGIFQTYLQRVFGERGKDWEEKTLGEISSVKGGKRVPKGYRLSKEPTNHPYLRVTEFSDAGSIDMSDLRYVSSEVHRQIKRYVIYSSDLYLSIAGTIGKTGIIPPELDGANLTENACRLVFHSGISNRFVYYFTTTQDFVEQAGLNTRTSAQPKLALSRLSTIKLGIPPLPEQQTLASSFDALREQTRQLESIYEQKIVALERLKGSLLHQAFAGKI